MHPEKRNPDSGKDWHNPSVFCGGLHTLAFLEVQLNVRRRALLSSEFDLWCNNNSRLYGGTGVHRTTICSLVSAAKPIVNVRMS